MEYAFLGSEAAGPTLRLDHEEFAYAGKFVMSSTGKTVARENDTLVGAVAFSADTTDSETVRLRYVTVRERRRGEGIGPRLLRFTAHELADSYDSVEIAVNNPIAYEACYRAGFVFTGAEAGIAELRMRYQPTGRESEQYERETEQYERETEQYERETEQYRAGFAVFENRDLPPEHERICHQYGDSEPPEIVAVPTESSGETARSDV